MYKYMYMYMYTCIYIYIYMYMSTFIKICTHICVSEHMRELSVRTQIEDVR